MKLSAPRRAAWRTPAHDLLGKTEFTTRAAQNNITADAVSRGGRIHRSYERTRPGPRDDGGNGERNAVRKIIIFLNNLRVSITVIITIVVRALGVQIGFLPRLYAFANGTAGGRGEGRKRYIVEVRSIRQPTLACTPNGLRSGKQRDRHAFPANNVVQNVTATGFELSSAAVKTEDRRNRRSWNYFERDERIRRRFGFGLATR